MVMRACGVVCMCIVRGVCGVVYVLRVCVWDVRFVIWCCGVLCCVVMCDVGAGVGVQCVVCGVCVCSVCCLCVARLGTRKNPPCVDSKRPRVYV